MALSQNKMILIAVLAACVLLGVGVAYINKWRPFKAPTYSTPSQLFEKLKSSVNVQGGPVDLSNSLHDNNITLVRVGAPQHA